MHELYEVPRRLRVVKGADGTPVTPPEPGDLPGIFLPHALYEMNLSQAEERGFQAGYVEGLMAGAVRMVVAMGVLLAVWGVLR